MNIRNITILSILSVVPVFSYGDWWYGTGVNRTASELVANSKYAETKGGGGSALFYYYLEAKNLKLTVDADIQVHKFVPQVSEGSMTFDIAQNKTLTWEEIVPEYQTLGNFKFEAIGGGNLTLLKSYFYSKGDAEGNLANPVWDFSALTGTTTFESDLTTLDAGVVVKANNLIARHLTVNDATLTVSNFTSKISSGAIGNITANGNSDIDITYADGQRIYGSKVVANDNSNVTLDFSKSTSINSEWSPTVPTVANGTSTITIIGANKAFNNASFTVAGDGATINVENNSFVYSHTTSVCAGGNLNLEGTKVLFVTKSTTFGEAGAQKGANISINSGDAVSVYNNAILTINNDKTVVRLLGSTILELGTYGITGTLNLNASNVFTDAFGSAQGDFFTLKVAHNSALNLGAKNDFYEVILDAGKILTVALNGNAMTFENFEAGEGAYILFNDFDENLVSYEGFRDALVLNDNGSLANLKAMKDGSLTDLYLLDNGYLSFSNIPEPSTYAIFAGLIALGVAVYRRRK